MAVVIIDNAEIEFNKFNSTENEKFNLWPVEFDSINYHAGRLKDIPNGKVLFFGHFIDRELRAVLEFQYNDYDTLLRGFICGAVINIYHKPHINSVERKISINELLKFLQKFRKQEKIRFCFIAISNWDNTFSIAAQEHGFNFILTWGKCFYNQDRALYLPPGYRVSREKKEENMADFLEMTKDYFKGGRFYLDSVMDNAKTDKMYKDLVTSCFNSPDYDFIVLLNTEESPVAAFISKKETYNFDTDFEVHKLRFLLSNRNRLGKGIAAPFLSETSRLLSAEVGLVESGIEMHNLPSLKIHTDAGYKFNYIYSAYHSWI